MPYSTVSGHDDCDGGIAVVKDEDEEVMGCHESEDAAREQIAALSAAESEKAVADVDLTPPPRVVNAAQAALDAKEEYDDLSDCGGEAGRGEQRARQIVNDDLSPADFLSRDNGTPIPAYLESHAEDVEGIDAPPTEWGEETWTDGCGPVQYALWGWYLDWAQGIKEKLEAEQEKAMRGPYAVFGTATSGDAEGEAGYFYPVYLSEAGARSASFDGSVHAHSFAETQQTYYMPGEPAVHAANERPDLPLIAGNPPDEIKKSMPDTETKADPADLSKGALVEWSASGGSAQGRIVEVGEGDTLDPSTTDRTYETSEENPGYLIELVDRTAEGGVETRTEDGEAQTVFHRPDTLSVINADEVSRKALTDSSLAVFGGAAKAMGDGKVGGYLVRFTEPGDTDLQNDFFTKATDFGPHETTVVLYDHGRDGTLGRKALDQNATLKMDDTGVWVEAQLDRREEYEEAIYQMAKAGKLGWSSGTASHLVERERSEKGGYHVKSWMLGLDASLTPTPVEPRNAAVPAEGANAGVPQKAVPVKSLPESDEDLHDYIPDSLPNEDDTTEMPDSEMKSDPDKSTEQKMMDGDISPLRAYKEGLITKNEFRKMAMDLDEIEGGNKTVDEMKSADEEAKAGGGKTVTTQYEGGPAYNRKTGVGDSPAKAFQHWARTGDSSGLPSSMMGGEATPDDVKSAKLHGATMVEVNPETDKEFKAMKADQDLTTGAGSGQDAIPEGHFNNIISRRDEMMLANEVGVRDIPGEGTTVDVPIDDNTGEEFVQTAEASANDRDTPTISNISFTLDKYTKRVPLTNELMQDEASRLMSFIEDYVARGQAKTHNDLLVSEVATNGTAFTTFNGTDSIAFGEPEDILADDDLGFYIDDSESVNWVTRNSTLWSIKSLTGNDRQYDRGLFNEGEGQELLGYPVKLSNKVDQPGTSNKPLLFGNFNFVGKREDPGFTVLRDPYSRAEEGIVQLHYYFRTVYKVMQSEAVGYGQNA